MNSLHPLLSDWLREQAQHNGTTELWELEYAAANYVNTVDPDWRSEEVQVLLAEMERKRGNYE